MYDGRHVVGRRHRLDAANKLQQRQRMLGNAVVRPRRELKLPNFALVQVVTLNTRGASVHISSYMGHGAKTITLSGAKALVLSRKKARMLLRGKNPQAAKAFVLSGQRPSCCTFSHSAAYLILIMPPPRSICLSVCPMAQLP